MLFMVIEHFRPGRAPEVYSRFAEKGRMAPAGVVYHSSWVDHDFDRCFQVMEADSEAALAPWIEAWHDLVEFEVIAVRTSAEAAEQMSARMSPRRSEEDA